MAIEMKDLSWICFRESSYIVDHFPLSALYDPIQGTILMKVSHVATL